MAPRKSKKINEIILRMGEVKKEGNDYYVKRYKLKDWMKIKEWVKIPKKIIKVISKVKPIVYERYGKKEMGISLEDQNKILEYWEDLQKLGFKPEDDGTSFVLSLLELINENKTSKS